MSTYIVTGPRTVAGAAPGETLTAEQLAGTNIAVLTAAGHITPTQPEAEAEADTEPEADSEPEPRTRRTTRRPRPDEPEAT